MASLSIYFLILFHVLFFWGIYTNPYQLATSELLSTFFPTWIWQGREWVKGRIPKYEACYWLNSHSHPVLSTYYPMQIITSIIGNLLSLDNSFILFLFNGLAHFLVQSIGWYLFLKPLGSQIALFGAITFTYQAYHIKQQPCIIYTLAWFPWLAIYPPLAIGMILLAGYYPLAVYLLPLGLFLNHGWLPWACGIVIGSIQLVPFLKYLPKTIKSNKQKLEEVGPWETNFYIGIAPVLLLLINFKPLYLFILLPIIMSILLKSWLPRIHQRTWIISAYLAIFFSLQTLLTLKPESVLLITCIQCLDLWVHNRNLIPTRPYCELYKKPSLAFNTSLTRYLDKHLEQSRVSGLPWPLFTGIINNFKTLGYSGGMQLKLMAKWRQDSNPNGSGEHDYFRSNTDDGRLTRHRVRFAWSRKRPNNWLSTEIKHLYRNPEV